MAYILECDTLIIQKNNADNIVVTQKGNISYEIKIFHMCVDQL